MAEEQKQSIDANSRLKALMRATVPTRKTSLLKKMPEQLEETLAVPESETAKQNLVSFTLRVEDLIDKKLKSLCTDENITKETFLEAAFLVCSENEQMLQEVLKIAKDRRQLRKNHGIVRRAESMAKYLPSRFNEQE